MIYQKRELLYLYRGLPVYGIWFNITEFEYNNKIGSQGEYRKMGRV